MLIRLGFYSCAFASFVDAGGFAAELGRFGETTLPLGFRWAPPGRGGKTEILTTSNTNFHEWGKIQMLIRLGFYSCAFASFVDEGGFAADLGRFGETTLPLGFR